MEADDYRFKKIKKLILFNPRDNVIYTLKVGDIPGEVIDYIKARWGKVVRSLSRVEIEEITKVYKIS